MNGRLYRLTPAGGKPNHYTDSYASTLQYIKKSTGLPVGVRLAEIAVGSSASFEGIRVERVA